MTSAYKILYINKKLGHDIFINDTAVCNACHCKTALVFNYRRYVLLTFTFNRSYLMDANKYKSVAIKVEVYNKARPMAEKDYCTMGGFISKLIEQESKKRKGKNGNKAN